MKRTSFLRIFSVLFGAVLMASSCEDMLTPDLTRYSDRYAADSVYSALGIVKAVQKIGERTVIIDAARSDLATVGDYTTDSIQTLALFQNPEDGSSVFLNVADYYHIINSCNFYLARVDTVSTKNGKNEMLYEASLVEGVRAWVYLQLVKLYGSVPYITAPVDDAELAKALESNAPRASKDNLIDLLLESGIERALTIQGKYDVKTNYGSLNDAPIRNMFFPIQLTMGDAYLLKNDYENAAASYYDFFEKINYSDNNSSFQPSVTRWGNAESDADQQYQNTSSCSWRNLFTGFRSGEYVSVTTHASSQTQDGVVYKDLYEMFGFDSQNSRADEKKQQILPALGFTSLADDQKLCQYKDDDNVIQIRYYDKATDNRGITTCPNVEWEFNSGEKHRIIAKYMTTSGATVEKSYFGSFSANHIIPFYRMAQIYLQYAEAINRLGYPQMAFGILKDGLYRQAFPEEIGYRDENKYIYYRDTVKIDTISLEPFEVEYTTVLTDSAIGVIVDGEERLFPDGVIDSTLLDPTLLDRPYVKVPPPAYTGGMYYLSAEEYLRAKDVKYLNFWEDSRWNRENSLQTTRYYGIHSRGCKDVAGRMDTVYTFARMVAKKVALNRAKANAWTAEQQLEEEQRLAPTYDELLSEKKGGPSQDEIIEAVEELIVDENALETAYEGHRFTDLLRFANHKANPKEWLGWKMGRRNVNVTAPVTEYDASLYSKMQDEKNWYLALPKAKK